MATTGGTGALSFNNIRAVGANDVGQFRVMGELFGWKNRNPSSSDPTKRRVIQHEANDVVTAEWYKTSPKECQLKFRLKSGNSVRFDGFRDSDFDVILKHFESNTKIQLKRVKLATRGWHWGEYEFRDNEFCFKVDGSSAFSINIPKVHSVNNPSKNDISLEFAPDDDDDDGRSSNFDDRLLEVRFALPPSSREDEDQTNALREMLLEKSGARAASSEGICMLQDVRVLVPSARFDINMMRSSMKLHGKSNDFIVPYKTITRMFLLPGPQPTSVSFVLSLDVPLRKGNTRHPNIIIQFEEKKHLDLTVDLSEEEIRKLQESHPNIAAEMSGREYDVITRLFKALIGRPVTVPGDFKNSSGLSCFRCSNKAHSGHFYPLSKMALFIPKPVIIMKYDDVVNVEFGRTSGSQTRLFEFKVSVKGGLEYEFSSVDRHEYQPLLDFLQKKGIRVRNLNQEKASGGEKSFLDEDLPSDESDEDFEANSTPSDSTSGDEDDEEDEDEEEGHGSSKKSGAVAGGTHTAGTSSASKKRKSPGGTTTNGPPAKKHQKPNK